MADSWCAAVLTGGGSRRMGRDKSLLTIDGEPMAARVASALREAGAVEVTCIGGNLDELRAFELDAIEDQHPGEGPLGGVLTAMAWAISRTVLVTPCDLVHPLPGAFEKLVTALERSRMMAALPIVDGQWRPLPAALRPSALESLAAAFAEGERAVHRAMTLVDFVTVDVGPLTDADTPEDLPDHR